MTARPTISIDAIVAATLDLIREAGWDSVSARSLAQKLGSSTMPIYSSIGSMEELRRRALGEASRLLDLAQHVARTGNGALDLALGYVVFAREEAHLFRFIVDNQGNMAKGVSDAAASPAFEAELAASKPIAEVMAELSAAGKRNDFVLRSWIFAYGLAELVSGGHVSMDDTEIARHLQAAGGAFYLYERQESGPASYARP